MSKRTKRLEKQEQGLLEQARKHRIKAETLEGRKDTTRDYWLKEAARFEEQARERAEMLEKLRKKKHDRVS
jgi:hypothetical protein